MANEKISAMSAASALTGAELVPVVQGGANKKATVAQFGMLLIDNGTISAPVEFLDISLPSGYFEFTLVFTAFQFSANDSLALAVSQDGGSSFINDATNFDSYYCTRISQQDTALSARAGGDSLAYLVSRSQGSSTSALASVSASINPGSATCYTSLRSFGQMYQSTLSNGGLVLDSGVINPDATVSPTLARANLVRILPYGNGDCDPPTSGETIIAGSWSLFGIPAP